jgi:hypothetical protein
MIASLLSHSMPQSITCNYMHCQAPLSLRVPEDTFGYIRVRIGSAIALGLSRHIVGRSPGSSRASAGSDREFQELMHQQLAVLASPVPKSAKAQLRHTQSGLLPSSSDEPTEQERAVLYSAPQVDTCAAEVFQTTRRTDRIRNAPALVIFSLNLPIILLDLCGAFPTKIGASTAIHSGPRSRARTWARQLYEAYPDVQGFQYGSSMNGYAPAIVLNERAREALPKEPPFHRALNDDMLVDVLQRIALRLSYGLR